MADLRTNYVDDILDTSTNERRKYRMITNDDGTVSFVDVTDYSQIGDSFGSNDLNAITNAVNENTSSIEQINVDITALNKDLVTTATNIQTQLNTKAGLGQNANFNGVFIGNSTDVIPLIFSQDNNVNFRYAGSDGNTYFTDVNNMVNAINAKSGALTVIHVHHPTDVVPNSTSPHTPGTSSFTYDVSSAIPAGYSLLFGICSVAWFNGNHNGMAITFTTPIFTTATGTITYNAIGARLDDGSYVNRGFRPSFYLVLIKG